MIGQRWMPKPVTQSKIASHSSNQIRAATRKAGRVDGSVQLVGATKSVAIGDIRRAVDAGLTLAGENRLQEALPKIEALKDTGVIWHFIGRLQRRKVRSVVGIFDLIHSVDSLELAHEIDRRARAAGLRQKILLEVNIGEEHSKAGFLGDEVVGVLLNWGHSIMWRCVD